MNVEANYDQPVELAKPSKGPKVLKWLGCGCLVLILLCGGGIGVAWVFMGEQMMAGFEAGKIYQVAIEEAQVSPALIEKLGEPVKPDSLMIIPTASEEDGKNFMTYKVPFSGANGKATVVIKICAQPGSVARTEFFAETADGEKIDLDDDGGLKLNIDDSGGDDISSGTDDAGNFP